MGSFQVAFGGTNGSAHFFNMTVTQISQDTAANTSTVNIVVTVGENTHAGYWDLTGGPSYSATVNGTGYSGNFNYDWRAGGAQSQQVLNTNLVVAHSSDGTKSISYSGSANLNNSPGLTTASGSSSMALTTINRYATINSFTVTPVTDTSLTLNATVSNTCSALEYSTNNGSSYTTSSGSFTSKSVTVSNLNSGTAYNCKVRVTRSDSGLKTTSSTVVGTTAIQNKFFGRMPGTL